MGDYKGITNVIVSKRFQRPVEVVVEATNGVDDVVVVEKVAEQKRTKKQKA